MMGCVKNYKLYGMVMALLVLLLCSVPLIAAWGGTDDMIGEGEWIVKKVSKCPDDDKYTNKIAVSRRKVNRTHDGFNFHGILDFTLDNSRGIFIDACKYMDGGCKPYQTFADDCACCFIKKYAESNMQDLLTMAGLDPPDCPIPKGEINVTDYVFDYDVLPAKGIYGTYDATVYLLGPKAGHKPPERLACIIMTVHFDKISDDED